jgi:hypothetical protein
LRIRSRVAIPIHGMNGLMENIPGANIKIHILCELARPGMCDGVVRIALRPVPDRSWRGGLMYRMAKPLLLIFIFSVGVLSADDFLGKAKHYIKAMDAISAEVGEISVKYHSEVVIAEILKRNIDRSISEISEYLSQNAMPGDQDQSAYASLIGEKIAGMRSAYYAKDVIYRQIIYSFRNNGKIMALVNTAIMMDKVYDCTLQFACRKNEAMLFDIQKSGDAIEEYSAIAFPSRHDALQYMLDEYIEVLSSINAILSKNNNIKRQNQLLIHKAADVMELTFLTYLLNYHYERLSNDSLENAGKDISERMDVMKAEFEKIGEYLLKNEAERDNIKIFYFSLEQLSNAYNLRYLAGGYIN